MKKLLFSLILLASMILPTKLYAKDFHTYLGYYKELLAFHVSKDTINGVSTYVVDYDAWAKSPLHRRLMEELSRVNTKSLVEKDSGKRFLQDYENELTKIKIELLNISGSLIAASPDTFSAACSICSSRFG